MDLRSYCTILLVSLLMAIVSPSYLMARAPLVLIPENLRGQPIGQYLEILEETDRTLTIENILTEKIAAGFKPSDKPGYAMGFAKSAFWVRLQVLNLATVDYEWYLEHDYPIFDNLQLFVPEGAKTYTKISQSDYLLPYANKIFKLKTNTTVFPIITKPGLHTYYVRFEHRGSWDLVLNGWSRELIYTNAAVSQNIFGFYFGILAVMFFYNLFILLFTRSTNYLFYVLHIASFIASHIILYGYANQFIWPGKTVLNESLSITLAFIPVTTMLFARYYMETKKYTPILDKVIIAMIAVCLIEAAASIIVPFAIMLEIVVITIQNSALFCLFIGIRCLVRGIRTARFYTAAFSCMIVFTTLYMLKSLGVLPSTIMTNAANLVGPALMLTIFSVGLADQINTMKNELADLNANLEQKVQDRTVELSAAMEELEAMNGNLKATMEDLEAANEQLVQTRDALWGEMQLAKKIQTVLLPVNPIMKGYDIAAYMETADEVGGDYYDVISEGGKDWIMIGDVSGHGVPAGLIMMMVQTAIHTALSYHGDISPAQLLTIINKTITENIRRLGENKYMTITVLACIDGGNFYFAGLHQDIMVYRATKKTVENIETSGMWIGIFDELNTMVPDSQLHVDSGDVMVLYTDGITEARDSSGKMFGEKGLSDIMGHAGDATPEQIKDAIVRALDPYNKTDDVTLLILKRK